MIVVLDAPTTSEASTSLPPSCPDCSGWLRPWGYARLRCVRGRRGRQLVVRPPRVRCAGCRVTHVLLPAGVGAPRRADAVEVIAAALLAKARGHGHRHIAAELALPPATVRGWIRSATERADTIRTRATRLVIELDPLAAALN